MRFGPENKNLSNHSEKFFCIWVRACQPPCPVALQIILKSQQVVSNILKVHYVAILSVIGRIHSSFYLFIFLVFLTLSYLLLST